MVFGINARRAESKLRVAQASELEKRMQARMDQETKLADLQYQAKAAALLKKATEALDADKLDLFKALSSQALRSNGFGPALDGEGSSPSPNDTLTPHEKVLDRWRIVTTIILVLALFIALGFVLKSPTIAKTGTPYISLVSGLAGIALGWMFASAGNSNAARDSGTRTSGSSGARRNASNARKNAD